MQFPIVLLSLWRHRKWAWHLDVINIGRLISVGTINVAAKLQVDQMFGSWDIDNSILKLMTPQKLGMASWRKSASVAWAWPDRDIRFGQLIELRTLNLFARSHLTLLRLPIDTSVIKFRYLSSTNAGAMITSFGFFSDVYFYTQSKL